MIDGIIGIFRLWPIWMLLAGFYWYQQWDHFVKNEKEPLLQEIQISQATKTRLEQNLKVLEAKIVQIPALKQRLAELSSELDVLLSQLPRDFNNAQILRQMNDLGKRSSLDFMEFKLSPEMVSGFYSKLEISMKLQGSYPQLLLFFDRISKTTRIYNVTSMDFKAKQNKSGDFLSEVEAKATTFRYVESVPITPLTPEGSTPEAPPPPAAPGAPQ